jgi:hypothetical protein
VTADVMRRSELPPGLAFLVSGGDSVVIGAVSPMLEIRSVRFRLPMRGMATKTHEEEDLFLPDAFFKKLGGAREKSRGAPPTSYAALSNRFFSRSISVLGSSVT